MTDFTDKITLASYFQPGDIPTAAQFSELIDFASHASAIDAGTLQQNRLPDSLHDYKFTGTTTLKDLSASSATLTGELDSGTITSGTITSGTIATTTITTASINSGDITSTGHISAASLSGDGNGLTNLNIPADLTLNSLVVDSLTVNGAASVDSLSASGEISTGSNLNATGNISADGDLSVTDISASAINGASLAITGNSSVTGNSTVDGSSTVSGNSSVGGDLTVSGQINGDGSGLSSVPASAISGTLDASQMPSEFSPASLDVSGDFSAGSVTTGALTADSISADSISTPGAITAASLTTTGDSTVNGNSTVSGNLTVSGQISGNGSGLTHLDEALFSFVTRSEWDSNHGSNAWLTSKLSGGRIIAVYEDM